MILPVTILFNPLLTKDGILFYPFFSILLWRKTGYYECSLILIHQISSRLTFLFCLTTWKLNSRVKFEGIGNIKKYNGVASYCITIGVSEVLHSMESLPRFSTGYPYFGFLGPYWYLYLVLDSLLSGNTFLAGPSSSLGVWSTPKWTKGIRYQTYFLWWQSISPGLCVAN